MNCWTISQEQPKIRDMRALCHPAEDDITVEGILHALSNPTRVRIFAELAEAGCPQTCSAFLNVTGRGIAKSSLSEHFRVLREAGLIRSQRQGIEMLNTVQHDALHDRFGKMITAILETYTEEAKRKDKQKRRS
jgi:DNA-binding transcriptional ArsR family regulator